jgi:branched-subunit amino acid aminotransferase/4-amino-4-deoxychorismate lyase
VIDIAKEAGLEVEERDPSLEEVLAADEAFLTAVNKYIVPVTRIDEQTIGSGKPGRVTTALSTLLQQQLQKDL